MAKGGQFSRILQPILLSRLQAVWKSGYSILNWLAELPINFNRFEIERSMDGVTFNKIDQVDYIVNKSLYSYEDRAIPAGAAIIYYRLKLVDGNGSFAYSSVVVIKLAGTNKINIYPNPADDFVTIELGNNAKGNYTLQLIDAMGREVNKIVVFNALSNQLVKIKRNSSVGAGVYILKISSNYYNQSSVSKIIYK